MNSITYKAIQVTPEKGEVAGNGISGGGIHPRKNHFPPKDKNSIFWSLLVSWSDSSAKVSEKVWCQWMADKQVKLSK